LQRAAWGGRSVPQIRKIKHRKKKNPPGKETGGRWRRGEKRIFPKPLTLQVIGSGWWAGWDSAGEQEKTRSQKNA